MIFFHYCILFGFRYMEIRMDLLPKRNQIPTHLSYRKRR